MTTRPLVSVVTSVYNDADALQASLESVLSQKDVDLEVIAVNDGSQDSSGAILERVAAADSRVRVLHQENRGLTRSLIRGCALARGEYIARQDCGDLSHPGRLGAQLQAIAERPEVVLVSCGTSVVGPQGEALYDVAIGAEDLDAGLLTLDPKRLCGPSHHGSTLFRRSAFERVGGYREQFYFAQDLDLWIRMAERGRHFALPAMLYQARFTPGSISGTQRRRQLECASLILECASRRRAGRDESPVLERAMKILPEHGDARASDIAAALYFIGVCLRKRGDPRASGYFHRALHANPLHLKSALRLFAG
jgi:glycosyltransferase involved in cell wall biosynthesis